VASTYEPIASTTLTNSTTASVTFGSGGTLPQTYTDLILVINSRLTTGGYLHRIRFNGDTGSNYSYTTLHGNGSSAGSFRASSQAYGLLNYFGIATDTKPDTVVVHIMSYANTNVFKTVLSSAAGEGYGVDRMVNLWRSTSAITSLEVYQVTPFYSSGSTFSLYGIKAA